MRPPRLYIARDPSRIWLPSQGGLDVSAVARALPRELWPRPEFRPVMRGLIEEDPTAGLMWAVPTPEDLGLAAPTLDVAKQLVSEVPFLPAMRGLSALAAELHYWLTDQERHLAIAREVFAGDFLEAVERFVAEDRCHVVFDPRNLAAVQKLLVLHATDEDPPEGLGPEDWRRLLGALLVVSSALPSNDPPDQDADAVVDWEGWAVYTVQAALWYEQPAVTEALARAWGQYVSIAGDLEDHHAACPVDEWLAQTQIGVGVAQHVGAGLGFAAATGAFDPSIEMAERSARRPGPNSLDNTELAGHTAVLMREISSTRDEFKESFQQQGAETPMQAGWDYVPFEARPFLREPNGSLVLLSPRALVSWLTRGIHYRLLDAARRQVDPRNPDGNLAGRWLTYAGALGEEYVRRLLAGSVQRHGPAGVARLYGEVEYEGPGGRQDSPDAALEVWPDLILFEVYSGRMSRLARSAEGRAEVRSVLERALVGKLTELLARARDVLAGQLEYPGATAQPLRVWPVLVLAGDPMMQTAALWNWLHQRMPELALVDARLRRPVICDLDDLEAFVGLVERGESFPGLLSRFVASDSSELPPKRWLTDVFGPDLVRPRYVQQQWAAAFEAGVGQLFPGSRRLAQFVEQERDSYS